MNKSVARALQPVAVIFSLLIAPYFAIQSRAFDRDPDIWWHIRVGDWIAQHHAVPRVGIFSQHIERPWTAYSWLFDLLVARVHRAFGLPGIPALLIALEVFVWFVFLLAIVRVAGSFWWGWLIATPAIFASYGDFLRPVQLTFLFFALELLLLFEADRKRDDKLLYWMAPLFLLWANCHIQFVYGLAVLALYVLSRVATPYLPPALRTDTPISTPAKLLGVFALAVVGSCVGPNWALPYKVALEYAGQTFIPSAIAEMHAMQFRHAEDFAELLLVMAACFALGISRRHGLFRPFVLAGTAVMSFRSQRDMWFCAIAAAFVIADAVRERPRAAGTETARRESPRWQLVSYTADAILALALALGFAARDIHTPAILADVEQAFPVSAAQFIANSHLQGPMYNTYNWGGFLIYSLPEQLVSIDPRADLYGDDLVRHSAETVSAVNWQSDPDFARANFVVLERPFPLASALASDPHYHLAYQDDIAVVFVKVGIAQQ